MSTEPTESEVEQCSFRILNELNDYSRKSFAKWHLAEVAKVNATLESLFKHSIEQDGEIINLRAELATLKAQLEQARAVIQQCFKPLSEMADITTENRAGWAMQAIEAFEESLTPPPTKE